MADRLMEWESLNWGDLVELKYGKSLKGYKGNTEGAPVYGTNGQVGHSTSVLCNFPSVIVGRKGAYRGIHFSSVPFFVIDTAFYIVPKRELNLKWAYYELLTQDINGLDSGSAIPSTRREDFYALHVKVPPIDVQNEIVGILDSFNFKINLNKKANQTLEQMAQALFKSWFVDFDPVIDNALAAGNWNASRTIPDELQARAEVRKKVIAERATNTKLKPLPEDIQQLFPNEFEHCGDPSLGIAGWIPKGWRNVNIHDLVDTVSQTFKLKEVDEVVFLNTGDIENGKFLHKNLSKTEGLPGQAKKSIKQGDILYSEIRPKNKRFALVNFKADDHVVSTKLMVLRAKVGVDSLLPYFILTQEITIQNLQHVAEHRSGTFPQITFSELADVTATLPETNILVDYFVSNYLKPFYDKRFSSIAQNEQLEQLRDTLLPKLISGEITI